MVQHCKIGTAIRRGHELRVALADNSTAWHAPEFLYTPRAAGRQYARARR